MLELIMENSNQVVKFEKSIIIIEFENSVYWYYIDKSIIQDGNFINKMENTNNIYNHQLTEEKMIKQIKLHESTEILNIWSVECLNERWSIDREEDATGYRRFSKLISQVSSVDTCEIKLNENSLEQFKGFLHCWKNNNLKNFNENIPLYFEPIGDLFKCRKDTHISIPLVAQKKKKIMEENKIVNQLNIENQLDNQGNDQIIYHDNDDVNHIPETEVDKYKFTDGEKLNHQELVDYLKNSNEEAEERFTKNGFKIELDSGIDGAVSFETPKGSFLQKQYMLYYQSTNSKSSLVTTIKDYYQELKEEGRKDIEKLAKFLGTNDKSQEIINFVESLLRDRLKISENGKIGFKTIMEKASENFTCSNFKNPDNSVTSVDLTDGKETFNTEKENENIKDGASKKMEELKEKSNDVKEDKKKKGENMVDDAKDAAHNASNKINDVKDQVSDKMDDLKHDMSNKYNETKSEAAHKLNQAAN
ncbi:hypothetical protein ACTA71_005174 [Dictyostelium dimigraforme]